MNLFASGGADLANQIDNARANAVTPEQVPTDWYRGIGTGLANGFKSAYYRDLYNVQSAAGSEPDSAQQSLNQIDQLRPKPNEVGFAGQIAYGLSEAIGAGALSFAGGNVTPQMVAMDTSQSYAKSQTELNKRQGMDPATAQSLATIEGIGFGAGMVMPVGMAGNLGTRVASGAAVNTVFGLAIRTASFRTLENAGYPEMAKQYEAFAAAPLMTDVMIGSIFGGLLGHRAPGERALIKPSDVDPILTLNNAAHIEVGTAPGMPVDALARQAHVDAVNGAIADLMGGRDVHVDPAVTEAGFVENPETTAAREQTVRVVQDHMGSEWEGLHQELTARGLPTDDIDLSGPVVVERASQAPQTLEEFVAKYPKETEKNPHQELRDFEERQQTYLLSTVQKMQNGSGGLTLEALRDLGLASTMKDAMGAGMGRLVKSKEKGGMSVDMLAERLHQEGWIPTEDVNLARELLSNVFAKKGQREPVVHSTQVDEHSRLQRDANDYAEFSDYTIEQARQRARALGHDEDLAAANPAAAHAFFDRLEYGDPAAIEPAKPTMAPAAFDPQAQVKIEAIHPETGKTVTMNERADVALRDNADRIQKMKGLLECLLG